MDTEGVGKVGKVPRRGPFTLLSLLGRQDTCAEDTAGPCSVARAGTQATCPFLPSFRKCLLSSSYQEASLGPAEMAEMGSYHLMSVGEPGPSRKKRHQEGRRGREAMSREPRDGEPGCFPQTSGLGLTGHRPTHSALSASPGHSPPHLPLSPCTPALPPWHTHHQSELSAMPQRCSLMSTKCP